MLICFFGSLDQPKTYQNELMQISKKNWDKNELAYYRALVTLASPMGSSDSTGIHRATCSSPKPTKRCSPRTNPSAGTVPATRK
jgi:hypothetical protein